MSGGVLSMLSMANRTYLYAQKDNEFTGIGEFRYDAPFLALLFTHIDTVAIPSILFDLGDIKVGAFRGRLETTQVTDFLTKLRALFDVHRSKILPKIWEAIEPSFAEITETKLRSGALLDEEQAWWFLRELGLTGFFSPILYFNLR